MSTGAIRSLSLFFSLTIAPVKTIIYLHGLANWWRITTKIVEYGSGDIHWLHLGVGWQKVQKRNGAESVGIDYCIRYWKD